MSHYGHSHERPAYAICGKQKADVVITFYPARVTCPTCIEELRRMEFVDPRSGETRTGAQPLPAPRERQRGRS